MAFRGYQLPRHGLGRWQSFVVMRVELRLCRRSSGGRSPAAPTAAPPRAAHSTSRSAKSWEGTGGLAERACTRPLGRRRTEPPCTIALTRPTQLRMANATRAGLPARTTREAGSWPPVSPPVHLSQGARARRVAGGVGLADPMGASGNLRARAARHGGPLSGGDMQQPTARSGNIRVPVKERPPRRAQRGISTDLPAPPGAACRDSPWRRGIRRMRQKGRAELPLENLMSLDYYLFNKYKSR